MQNLLEPRDKANLDLQSSMWQDVLVALQAWRATMPTTTLDRYFEEQPFVSFFGEDYTEERSSYEDSWHEAEFSIHLGDPWLHTLGWAEKDTQTGLYHVFGYDANGYEVLLASNLPGYTVVYRAGS